MITIGKFEDDFYKWYQKEKRPIIVYGAGHGFRTCKDFIPRIDMICDKNADVLREVCGVKINNPQDIREFSCPIYIIVSIIKENVFDEVCVFLDSLNVDAVVFHAFNNCGLVQHYSYSPAGYRVREKKKFRVNIVCEDKEWILHKFAIRLYENLKRYNVDVALSKDTNGEYDINHHIQFASYRAYCNDTIMVSHIDGVKSLCMLRHQLETAAMAVCMSRDTMNYLCSMGLPREKLCFINPAHDDVIPVKKYVIGITHRCYEHIDVRKRTNALLDIIDGIDCKYFKFIIMGSGWDSITLKMQQKGFEVDYYSEFEYEKYSRIFGELDYYLFMGFDEGSMGYLDALSAGVGTIVTPQGFHLDNHYPIDYPCRTIDDFRNSLLILQNRRKERVNSVSKWTWDMYAKKHLEIWNYIMRQKELSELYHNQLWYEDGIFSVLPVDNRV